VPGDEKRDGPPTTKRPPPTVPPGTVAILPDPGDPRRIGELLGDWLAIRMAEVDELVAEARVKVATLPDRRVLDQILGELVVRVRALELDVAELKAARR
jgi:hypothetical protein